MFYLLAKFAKVIAAICTGAWTYPGCTSLKANLRPLLSTVVPYALQPKSCLLQQKWKMTHDYDEGLECFVHYD